MAFLTRRNFVATGGIAAATVALPGKALGEPKVSLGKTAGIQLYTVLKELQDDLTGTLAKLAAMGYRFVESAGTAGKTAGELRKALDDAGLQCPSSHLFPAAGQTPEEFIAGVKVIGSKYLVTSVILPPSANIKNGSDVARYIDSLTLDDYKRMVDAIHALALKAQAAGLQLAFHNHNAEFKKGPSGSTGFEILMAGLDPALVNIELDCGWADLAGYSPNQLLRTYAGRVKMLHVKDFKPVAQPNVALAEETRPQWTLLSKGHIDYASILHHASTEGVEHVYIEQEPPYRGFTALEAAKLNLDYLRSLG